MRLINVVLDLLRNIKGRYVTRKSFNRQQFLRSRFKSIGIGGNIDFPNVIVSPECISIGESFFSLYNLRLEAIKEIREQRFNPEIIIGNNVCLNTDVHIGCTNQIVIGDNVLIASRVYITDHSHGEVTIEALNIPPNLRPIISKGPVIIEDNVWIGEGVCILSGVTIGKNAIIGANSLVTKNVSPNSVVGGVPARVIKQL